jgi:hypothetical protein
MSEMRRGPTGSSHGAMSANDRQRTGLPSCRSPCHRCSWRRVGRRDLRRMGQPCATTATPRRRARAGLAGRPSGPVGASHRHTAIAVPNRGGVGRGEAIQQAPRSRQSALRCASSPRVSSPFGRAKWAARVAIGLGIASGLLALPAGANYAFDGYWLGLTAVLLVAAGLLVRESKTADTA